MNHGQARSFMFLDDRSTSLALQKQRRSRRQPPGGGGGGVAYTSRGRESGEEWGMLDSQEGTKQRKEARETTDGEGGRVKRGQR